MNTKPKIGVVGWYGHGNAGDEAYKLSFPLLFPGYDFTFLESPDPSLGLDGWVLGGGDVVSRESLGKFKGIDNKHVLSATVSNPYDFSGFGTVAVRDYRSLNVAQNRGAGTVLFAPDFAFALTGDAGRGRGIIRDQFAGADVYERVVTVVVNGYLMGDSSSYARDNDAFQNFSYSLATALDETSASVLFLPFGCRIPPDDRVTNGWVGSKCKYWQKVAVSFQQHSVQDTIDIIAGSDAVVSTRLHSSIFSCACATPFVDITHNHKNLRFLESVGYQHFMDYRGFDPSKFKEMMSRLLDNRRDESAALAAVAQGQRNQLADAVKNVDLV